MLLKECYDAFGGNYESVKLRISKDEIIKKFLIKFLSEPSFQNLCEALEEENYQVDYKVLDSVCAIGCYKGYLHHVNNTWRRCPFYLVTT